MNVNPVNVQTVNNDAGSTVKSSSDGGFENLIMQLVADNDGNETLKMLSAVMKDENEKNVNDILSQLLSQIISSQNISSDSILQMLNGENVNAGEFSDLTGILSENTDNSQFSVIENLLQINNVLTENENSSETDFSQLLKIISSSAGDENGLIPTSSAIPLETLSELLKAENKTADTVQVSDDEKMTVLKTALEKGEVSFSKDTDINGMIAGLTEKYRISQAVKNSGLSENNEITKNVSDEKQADGTMAVIDYTSGATEVPETVKPMGTEEENAVFSQTLDSITKSLEAGTESYTAKLNPEGLGEVIVKMVKDADKIVISIEATSRKTAEILNSQLNALQNNLDGFNAQINRVEVVPSQETAQYHGYSFSGQNSDGNEGQMYENNQRPAYYYSKPSEDEVTDETAEKLREGRINTFI